MEHDIKHKKSKELQDQLVWLGLEYIQKMSGKIGDNDILRLRDAVSYRARSFKFHIDLLDRICTEEITKANTEKDNDLMGLMILQNAPFSIYAIFDSITFHASSLFDYLGGLILYICDRENTEKFTWGELAGVKNGRFRNGRLKDSLFAPIVIQHHDAWLKDFFNYRAGIIHFEPKTGGSQISYDCMKAKYSVFVHAPKEFVDIFSDKMGDSLKEKGEISLQNAVTWLAEQSLISVIDIVAALRKYIEGNRKIETDNEIIQFKIS